MLMMQLVIGWTCVGVFIATAVITLLALTKVIELAHKKYLDRLFKALILEVVAGCIGAFTGLLPNPGKVEKDLVAIGEVKGEERGHKKGEEEGIKKAEEVILPEVRKLKSLLGEKQAIINRIEPQANVTPQERLVLKRSFELNEDLLKSNLRNRITTPVTR